MDGTTLLKKDFFTKIGLIYVEVLYSEFKGMEENDEKIKEKLI